MDEPRPTADLPALERLAKEATPGPWKSEGEQVFIGAGMSKIGIAHALEANATYIAAASPGVMLALIAEVREARKGLEDAPESAARPAVGEEGPDVERLVKAIFTVIGTDGYENAEDIRREAEYIAAEYVALAAKPSPATSTK